MQSDGYQWRLFGTFTYLGICTHQTDQSYGYISMNVICAGTLGWMPWMYCKYMDGDGPRFNSPKMCSEKSKSDSLER